MSQRNAIWQKLHALKVSALATEQGAVRTVKAADPLETVCKIMSEAKLHALPVVDDKGVCLGVVDMLDAVVHALAVAPPKAEAGKKPLTRWGGDVKASLERAGRALALVAAKDVMNASGKDAYTPLEADSEATLAVQVFAQGVHRAPLLDREGRLVGALSQSSVVRWLISEAKTYFKELPALDLYLADAGLGGSSPVSVAEGDTVVHALAAMAQAGVSAVPLVDQNGKLSGNFSAQDLIGLVRDRLPQFEAPVRAFLQQHSPASLQAASLPGRDTTVRHVLAFFESKPFHRVWIVDNDGRPTGVVSHTDLMAFIRDHQGA